MLLTNYTAIFNQTKLRLYYYLQLNYSRHSGLLEVVEFKNYIILIYLTPGIQTKHSAFG